jgi:hypothetical protein
MDLRKEVKLTGEGRSRGAAGLGIERFNKLEAQREGWRGVRERIDD